MDGQSFKPITLLGAGSWGTALGLYLARRGQTVRVWSIEAAEITAMQQERVNNRYLPGYPLPNCFHPIIDINEAVKGVDDILVVVPSIGFRQTLITIKPLIQASARIICATKGLDTERGQLLSEVVDDILGDEHAFAMLSGPSFAKEVAAGMPTAVTIASRNQALLNDLTARFTSDIFQVDRSDDITGVEIGGVVKNVIAIATGISDGLGFGANTRSAIITRGLAEIMRLGKTLGGKPETFLGLSGLGDLILTCSDNQSRNKRLGIALGKGQDIKAAEKEIGQAIEGKRNAELVVKLAKLHNISMPVCETVWEVLQGRLQANEVITRLLSSKP